MARDYTAAAIIASLKRRALLSPSGTTPFGDTDWYALIDEEVRTYIWPLLREVHEDFFVRTAEGPIPAGLTSATLPGLPKRFLGESIKAILYDAGGGRFVKLDRLQPEEQGRQARGFWIEDDRLILSPTPTEAMTVRILYHLRPSQVVPVTSCYAITSNDGNRTVGVNTTGATWTPATNDSVDFVQSTPGLRVLQMDNRVDKYTPGTPPAATVDVQGIGATANIPNGSYLCRAEETPVPNIPLECFPLLAQQLAMLALEGRSGFAEAKLRRDELKEQVKAIFGNRIEGNDEVVQNYNAPGWGRRRGVIL